MADSTDWASAPFKMNHRKNVAEYSNKQAEPYRQTHRADNEADAGNGPNEERELEFYLQAAQHDAAFRVIDVLKESEWERTEMVADWHGCTFIRKYVHENNEGFGSQYRTVQKLTNPALPHVHEIYRIPDATVVILEYLQGATLREEITQHGPRCNQEACAMLLDICVGVQALHECIPPIIHRDINPSNVIITPRGVKLIDFGIARRYDEHARRDTRTWGTLGYAAPEQFGFGQSGPRTDIYALGMLYWFLLTGEDPQAGMEADVEETTRIPSAARHIIAQCIAWDPKQRYENISALSEALRAASCAQAKEYSAQKSRAESNCTRPQNTTMHSAPTGRTSRLLSQAKTVWRIIASACFGLFTLGTLSNDFSGWRMDFPNDIMIYRLYSLSILLFLFLPLFFVSTNIAGVVTRNPLLKKHRVRRIALSIAACILILCIASTTLTKGFSPEYLAAAAEHGLKF